MKKLLVLALLTAAVLSACGPSEVVVVTATPEPVDNVAEYLDWSDDLSVKWDDAVDIANSTSHEPIGSAW